MVEPTIPEMLRVGLKAVQERWEKPEERFRVHWPDDLEGQGLCITQLGNLARSPEVPWNVRVWAFDTLQAAAAQYNTNNNPSAIPTQIHTWALWVSSGAVERPKRTRGRDRDKNLVRDRVVACSIAWLRQYQGYTYEAAIELVAESIGLTVEAVKSKTVTQREKMNRHLSEQEKNRVLAAWDKHRRDYPNDGMYGRPDPTMNPWCDAINALPGVCTVQACSGHRRDIGGTSGGCLWLRLDEPASNRFDSLVDISFQGEEHGCLDATMKTIVEFLWKITSCSSQPYPWPGTHYPTRHSLA